MEVITIIKQVLVALVLPVKDLQEVVAGQQVQVVQVTEVEEAAALLKSVTLMEKPGAVMVKPGLMAFKELAAVEVVIPLLMAMVQIKAKEAEVMELMD